MRFRYFKSTARTLDSVSVYHLLGERTCSAILKRTGSFIAFRQFFSAFLLIATKREMERENIFTSNTCYDKMMASLKIKKKWL